MKYILFLISCVVLVSCSNKEASIVVAPVHVTVFDSDYSLAYTLKYEMTDSCISVTFIGGLVGESDSVLYQRELTKQGKGEISDFFMSFPLSSLRDEYITPNIDDGDQKSFMFEIGDIEKEIQTSNYYQEELSAVVKLFNELIPSEFHIYYENDMMKQ